MLSTFNLKFKHRKIIDEYTKRNQGYQPSTLIYVQKNIQTEIQNKIKVIKFNVALNTETLQTEISKCNPNYQLHFDFSLTL